MIDFFELMVNCFSKISCFFPEICRLISSAYKTVLNLEAFTMSLIYISELKCCYMKPFSGRHKEIELHFESPTLSPVDHSVGI